MIWHALGLWINFSQEKGITKFIFYFYMADMGIKRIKNYSGTRIKWGENMARTYLQDIKREKKVHKGILKADTGS